MANGSGAAMSPLQLIALEQRVDPLAQSTRQDQRPRRDEGEHRRREMKISEAKKGWTAL